MTTSARGIFVSSQLTRGTLKAVTWQRVKRYLNYLRIQMTAKPEPLWAHICFTAFAAQSQQSMKQPIADGNTNKGCRKISVQRSVGKTRHLNVVLSLFYKLENNRIGLWWRTLVLFAPVISFMVSHSPRKSAADSKGRSLGFLIFLEFSYLYTASTIVFDWDSVSPDPFQSETAAHQAPWLLSWTL